MPLPEEQQEQEQEQESPPSPAETDAADPSAGDAATAADGDQAGEQYDTSDPDAPPGAEDQAGEPDDQALTDEQIVDKVWEETIGARADQPGQQQPGQQQPEPGAPDPSILSELARQNGWDLQSPDLHQHLDSYLGDLNRSVQEVVGHYNQIQSDPLWQFAQNPQGREWLDYVADRLSRGYAPADLAHELAGGNGQPTGPYAGGQQSPSPMQGNQGNPEPEFDSDGERLLYQQQQAQAQQLQEFQQTMGSMSQQLDAERQQHQAHEAQAAAVQYNQDFKEAETDLANAYPDQFTDQGYETMMRETIRQITMDRSGSGQVDVRKCMERACRQLDYPNAQRRGARNAISQAKQRGRQRTRMGDLVPAGGGTWTEDDIANQVYDQTVGPER